MRIATNNDPPSQKRYPMPFVRVVVAVLTVKDGALAVLQGLRQEEPQAGRWGLPGGVLRIDKDEDLEAAAQRIAGERINARLPFLRQLAAVRGPKGDPRADWTLNIAYRALVPFESIAPSPGKRTEALRWVAADEAIKDRKLAFDHAGVITTAVETTRAEVERLELPFEFVPPTFTLGELQSICEAILGVALDKSSFRRKLEDRGRLEPVPGEMRTGPFRPAQVYRGR